MSRELLSGLKTIWAKANDCYFGIDTEPNLGTDPQGDPVHKWRYGNGVDFSAHRDAVVYKPAEYLSLRRVIRRLDLASHDLFYDLGCGKGRVICFMARRPLKSVVGIELDASLAAISRLNAARLRGRRTEVQVRCEDAASADLSDGTIYFLYNPFGRDTMASVFRNIERSLTTRPRMIQIVYHNAVYAELLDSYGWLRRKGEFRTPNGQRVILYVTRV